jgi:hypothetical protein
MRTRVYVAGPISKGDLQHNVDQAREASVRLIKAGYAVFTPQLSVFMGGNDMEKNGVGPMNAGISHRDWLEMDHSWVGISHAVLRLPGESVGADQEVSWALAEGIPVYTDINQLLSCLSTDLG